MVPPREDEVPNETLVAIDNEIATKFFGFFVMLYELSRRHRTKIASYRLGQRQHCCQKITQSIAILP
jgi:hypothetical protein